MITFFESVLSELAIHKLGSKAMNEPVVLSEKPAVIKDKILVGHVMRYLIGPFQNSIERYNFHHPSGQLELNEMYHFCSKIFEYPKSFHQISKQIAKQLYSVSEHPNIKHGEVYITRLKDILIDGEMLDAIGIFKSESKEPYLTIGQSGLSFQLGYEEEGINIKKLDKGCLIFNVNKIDGYKIAVVDHTNRSEAVYWVDDFLQLRISKDDYSNTNSILTMYKSFVTEKLNEKLDVSKTDKLDLLDRSIKYFKENEEFDLNDFSQKVIGDPSGVNFFLEYKREYESKFDLSPDDSFVISGHAVKKQARSFKRVLKLDKNFHIYIHGNPDMIEKGFDSEKNLNYYKVFFKQEL